LKETAHIEKQLRAHRRTLQQITAQAQKLLAHNDLPTDTASGFVTGRLAELSLQRDEVDGAIQEAEMQLASLRDAEVSAEAVRTGLANWPAR